MFQKSEDFWQTFLENQKDVPKSEDNIVHKEYIKVEFLEQADNNIMILESSPEDEGSKIGVLCDEKPFNFEFEEFQIKHSDPLNQESTQFQNDDENGLENARKRIRMSQDKTLHCTKCLFTSNNT